MKEFLHQFNYKRWLAVLGYFCCVTIVAWLLAFRCHLRKAVDWRPSNAAEEVLVDPETDPCSYLPPIRDNPNLPKILHFYWTTENLPELQKKTMAAWEALFPASEFQYKLWTDASVENLVKDHYPWLMAIFKGFPKQINRADAARLMILHYYGGLYADLDYVPSENFWSRLPDDVPALVESPYIKNEIVQNSLMASPRDHPFWLQVLHVVSKRATGPPNPKFPTYDPGYALYAAGPDALTEAFLSFSKVSHVQVLPCWNFQRCKKPIVADYGLVWRDGKMESTKFNRSELQFMMKDCGDPDDSRCLMGVHLGTSLWAAQWTHEDTQQKELQSASGKQTEG